LPGPSEDEAQRKYRRRVRAYDRLTAPLRRYRDATVGLLELGPGEMVFDVACGTGANFAAIQRRIGPEGALIGIDLSAEMLTRADERAKACGWTNVSLIEASVEKASLPAGVDAALFSLTHDVLQSRAAVANVVQHLREGGHVASFGAKWAGRAGAPVNLAVWLIARGCVTTLDGFDRPWHLLERFVDLKVHPVALGGAYLASGTKGSQPGSTVA
jgi:phosphatidylethanolamine/phosphatidyl-N-methylethanolamine N-methyltransferase